MGTGIDNLNLSQAEFTTNYLDGIKKNYLKTIKEINFLIEEDNIDTVFFVYHHYICVFF